MGVQSSSFLFPPSDIIQNSHCGCMQYVVRVLNPAQSTTNLPGAGVGELGHLGKEQEKEALARAG